MVSLKDTHMGGPPGVILRGLFLYRAGRKFFEENFQKSPVVYKSEHLHVL